MAVAHYLDCVDEEKSNWMRFVNCARFEEEQNLIAEQYDQLIFYKAYKKILPGDVRRFNNSMIRSTIKENNEINRLC